MSLSLFVNLILNGLTSASLYFLIAAGVSLIFGLMHVLNFAHGSSFMLGSYFGYTFYQLTNSFIIALLGAFVTGILVGFIIEYFLIRRFYGIAGATPQVLITLGIMMIVNQLVIIIWGAEFKYFILPAALNNVWNVLGINFSYYRGFLILFGVLVFVLLHYFLEKTRVGIIVRAGVEDSVMVQAFNINIHWVFRLVFCVGTGVAFLGGAMSAPLIGVYPTIGVELMFFGFIVVVVGGLESLAGCAVGAILVGFLQSVGGYFFPQIALIFNVLLMIIVLLIKPEGMFGKRR